MTIYNFIELLFVFFLIGEVLGKKSEKKRLLFFYTEAFIIIFILAFRNYNVGADSILYTNYYTDPNTYRGKMPIGFELFCDFLKLFSNNWHFFIFVTSVLSTIPFLYYVKKYSSIVSVSFITFLLCWELLWLLETPIKQTTAIFFFFWGYLFLTEPNKRHVWIKRLLGLCIIVFSVLIHSTIAFVIVVVLFISYINLSKKIAVLGIALSVLISSSIITLIPGFYEKLSLYTMSIEMFYNVQNYTEDIATGLITYDIKKYLLPSLYVIVLILISKEDELLSLPAKCLIAGTIIYNLFIAFPNIPRVVLFFTLLGSSFCPIRYRQILVKKNKNIWLIGLHFLLIVFFFYIHLKKCVTFTPTMSADILPYTFWFS